MVAFDETIIIQNKSNDLLAVGELLVDLISESYDELEMDSPYYKFFGGSPANIAMNVIKLGIQAQIASAVGKDRLGDFLLSKVQQAHLDIMLIEKVKHSTSIVVLNKSQGSPIPIFYRGADYQISYSPQILSKLQSSSILHFSCWPLSQEPARSTIEQIIDDAKKNQMFIGFDPNYHPALWSTDFDSVAYIQSIIGKVDMVKPSEDDAERLFGKGSPKQQIQRFLNLGARLVVYTMGEEGAIVSNGLEECYIPTLATEVIDTTGAGDAFWSGFYAGIVKQHTVREALYLGFAVSAYKLKHMGAIVDLPSLEEIKLIYKI